MTVDELERIKELLRDWENDGNPDDRWYLVQIYEILLGD